MHALKVRKVGNSLGVVLPKEALARLGVAEGDVLYLTAARDGGFQVTPYDPDFGRQMDEAEAIMREDRDVLRELSRR